MRGLAEFSSFAGLALALHVAALHSLPEGSQSAGAGGDALVTVVSASAGLSDMVTKWERPPDAAQVVPEAMPPAMPAEEMPKADAVAQPQVERMAAPGLPMPSSADKAMSRLSTAVPDQPPRVVEAPLPGVRPKSRPEAAANPPAAMPAPASPRRAKAAPQAPRTAAGSGAAAARGTSGPSDAATLTASARQSLLAEWGGKIRSRIDRARPQGSGRGTVTVLIKVRRDGVIQSVGLAKSSGQDALDRIAMRTVQQAGPMPPAPAALTDPTYSFRLPVRFN